MNEADLKLTLEFENSPKDHATAKEELAKECRLLKEWVNNNKIAKAEDLEIPTSNIMGFEIVMGTMILTILANKAADKAAGALIQYLIDRVKSGFQKNKYKIIVQKGTEIVEIKSSDFTDKEFLILKEKLKKLMGG